MGIFTPLIKELLINGEEFSTPRPYKEYKRLNGITSSAMTASILSIDYFDRLDSELRENNLMVFRLVYNNQIVFPFHQKQNNYQKLFYILLLGMDYRHFRGCTLTSDIFYFYINNLNA